MYFIQKSKIKNWNISSIWIIFYHHRLLIIICNKQQLKVMTTAIISPRDCQYLTYSCVTSSNIFSTFKSHQSYNLLVLILNATTYSVYYFVLKFYVFNTRLMIRRLLSITSNTAAEKKYRSKQQITSIEWEINNTERTWNY